MEYTGMLVVAETTGKQTSYRVIRMKSDGTANKTPFTFTTEEAAKQYVAAHGF